MLKPPWGTAVHRAKQKKKNNRTIETTYTALFVILTSYLFPIFLISYFPYSIFLFIFYYEAEMHFYMLATVYAINKMWFNEE